jgi:hypothetical protein
MLLEKNFHTRNHGRCLAGYLCQASQANPAKYEDAIEYFSRILHIVTPEF